MRGPDVALVGSRKSRISNSRGAVSILFDRVMIKMNGFT